MTNRPTNQICDTIVYWLNKPNPQAPDWSPAVWETFKFVCRVHGVAPLLHAKLKSVQWLDITVRNWLFEQYTYNAKRIIKMHGELAAILGLFAANNIPIMPLKGSILSTLLYENPAWRPMADLDFLIRPADLEAGTQLLNRLGYRQDVVHWKHIEFSKPDNRRVISKDYEHPENPRNLEIHLHCRETFGGPTVELTNLIWRYSVKGELLQTPAIVPGPAALWLHLLVHHTYHLWQGKGRLIHLFDLALLTPKLNHPIPAAVDESSASSANPRSEPICDRRLGGTDRLGVVTTGYLETVDPAPDQDFHQLLNTIDARFTYPALVMLKKYFPTAVGGHLLHNQKTRVSPSFQHWADSLDLVNTSLLNPHPAGLYLLKALKFTERRPREVGQALRFAFLPNLEELALDHPKLAKSNVPWLAYFLLPVDWVKRIWPE